MPWPRPWRAIPISPYIRFALCDGAGVLIWSGGYVGRASIQPATGEHLPAWLGRRRSLKQLEMARITPAELQQHLVAGENLFVIDLRSGLAEEQSLSPQRFRKPGWWGERVADT